MLPQSCVPGTHMLPVPAWLPPSEFVPPVAFAPPLPFPFLLSLAPSFGLDLNGRYIFMQQQNNIQFPTQFNPDFWSTSVGLAFKF